MRGREILSERVREIERCGDKERDRERENKEKKVIKGEKKGIEIKIEG